MCGDYGLKPEQAATHVAAGDEGFLSLLVAQLLDLEIDIQR
jgi:hypothetical protein